MYVAKYWSRAETHSPTDLQRKTILVQYGHSYESQDEANAMARQRLHTLVESAKKGLNEDLRHALTDYLHADPLREEFIRDEKLGTVLFVITRNSYGCLVLNVDRVMFVDLDFNPLPFLARLKKNMIDKLLPFLRKKKIRQAQLTWNTHPDLKSQTPRSEAELIKIHELNKYCQAHSDFGGRIYRTPNGLRMLVTSDFYLADSERAQNIMSELGSDKIYIRLCKIQRCFRARLTPKPWRCGFKRHQLRFPYTPQDQTLFNEWLSIYQQKKQNYQACS
jgi:hypothetical protein